MKEHRRGGVPNEGEKYQRERGRGRELYRMKRKGKGRKGTGEWVCRLNERAEGSKERRAGNVRYAVRAASHCASFEAGTEHLQKKPWSRKSADAGTRRVVPGERRTPTNKNPGDTRAASQCAY